MRGRDAGFDSTRPAGPARARGKDGRFIVRCPACLGSGRVIRPGSQVPVGCPLCWERGRVARIVAERYERAGGERGSGSADPDPRRPADRVLA